MYAADIPVGTPLLRVAGLQPSTTYQLRLQARNSTAISPYSAVLPFTTPSLGIVTSYLLLLGNISAATNQWKIHIIVFTPLATLCLEEKKPILSLNCSH